MFLLRGSSGLAQKSMAKAASQVLEVVEKPATFLDLMLVPPPPPPPPPGNAAYVEVDATNRVKIDSVLTIRCDEKEPAMASLTIRSLSKETITSLSIRIMFPGANSKQAEALDFSVSELQPGDTLELPKRCEPCKGKRNRGTVASVRMFRIQQRKK